MIPLLLATLPVDAPLRLTDASVGRREYALEIRVEDGKGDSMTETATVAERIVREGAAFRRTRQVVASLNSEGAETFRIGANERSILRSDNSTPERTDHPVPFTDVTFPTGPITKGQEWISPNSGRQRMRFRYEGETTIAGCAAVRLSLLEIVEPRGIVVEGAYVLLDRRDLLPLQIFFPGKVDLNGELKVLFRLRRANVPGLGLPN